LENRPLAMLILLKSGTLAMLHMAVAFGVAYAVTGSALLAAEIGLIEPCVFSVVFTLHERAWKALQ
jgi:uncharacterized membrane protein